MSDRPEPHHSPTQPQMWRGLSPVTSRGDQRVSDAERQGVIEQLRLNTGEGRLDIEEFGERVDEALRARTGAELSHVLRNLTTILSPEQQAKRRRAQVTGILAPYLTVNLFLVAIWAVAGAGYFWPIWPILGWGLATVMGLAAVMGGGNRSH